MPILYLPERPRTVQLGGPAELGYSTWRAMVGTLLLVLLTFVYGVARLVRRPWWRTKSLIESERDNPD